MFGLQDKTDIDCWGKIGKALLEKGCEKDYREKYRWVSFECKAEGK